MFEKRRYVELFAGCGGLSLGLEASNWQLEMANELSPMAAETFAYNLLGEVESGPEYSTTSSVTSVANIQNLKAEEWNEKKLVVGDVVKLVEQLKQRPELQDRFDGLDLVSGGPPCQGFSMAGKRAERDPKNKLPYAFVDFVELVKPDTVILENVEGILRPFKSDGGKKLPWLEIAKAFAIIGYAPICLLLNARQFGIPQNRPRFVMLGIKKSLEGDVLKKLNSHRQEEIRKIFEHAFEFANKDASFISKYSGNDPAIHIDVIKGRYAEDRNVEITEVFKTVNLLPEVNQKEISVGEAIDDLKDSGGYKGKSGKTFLLKFSKGTEYSQLLTSKFSSVLKHPVKHKTGLYNHELRRHSKRVTNRFIFLQEIRKLDNNIRSVFEALLRGKEVEKNKMEISRRAISKNSRLKEIVDSQTVNGMISSIINLRSNKQTQRAILKEVPAPAQMTIPDDICHYSDLQPRTLSVREMARIQSFPDEFVFRAKVTTGGESRKREVPQYTQVGNAVPPLLGKAIGEWVLKILE